jgi:hypothetical protein
MRKSVESAWPEFTAGFEGGYDTNFMYRDAKNLVTTAFGMLIDPISLAMPLPWRGADGGPATPEEVTQEWNTVKNGGPEFLSVAARGHTQLRLEKPAIDMLVLQKTRANEDYLRRRFPQYDNWPADAQMGLLSMAWAMGPAFSFPKFEAAANSRPPNFAEMANQSHMQGIGIDSRNNANKQLFVNAQAVVDKGLDPDTLYFPTDARTISGSKLLGEIIAGVGVIVAFGAAWWMFGRSDS